MKNTELCMVALLLVPIAVFLSGCVYRPAPSVRPGIAGEWDDVSMWEVTHQPQSTGRVFRAPADTGAALQMDYVLGGEHGWIQMKRKISGVADDTRPITFLIKAQATGGLEVKFVGDAGSVHGVVIPLDGQFADWTRVTARVSDMNYLWGNGAAFGRLAEFHIAVSGKGQGTIWLADIGFGSADLPSTFTRDPEKARPEGPFLVPDKGPRIDPDAEKPGIGVSQRRAAGMTPEDPLVLEWLKTLQDVSTPERRVLPTTAGDLQFHTFNNALAAMAFIVKGERERAERILDFFAAATVRDNQDPTLQNFFYKGEARGFFQAVAIRDTTNAPVFHTYSLEHGTDRWMGDMAWLLFAYKHYEQQYGGERYREITRLLSDLLISWFIDSKTVPGGGYIQSGWRKGDTSLHEGEGHPEGNEDAYAVLRLLGDEKRALKVRTWLEAVADGNSQPLDLYTWRVLAYNGERSELLNFPDYDLRYRKTVTVNGRPVTGPYISADITKTNIWLDGLGHLACAFEAAGNMERGYFYANQFDALLMDSDLGGKKTRTLPYVARRDAVFDFDQSGGYISAVSWYIFAKNGFNPMRLTKADVLWDSTR